MSDSNRRKHNSIGWLVASLLTLSACGPPHHSYYDPPSLGGPERGDAEGGCSDECEQEPGGAPDDSSPPITRVDEPIEREASADGQRDPAQERDDLIAQWRSALAAENMEALAHQQIAWTIVEIVLLFGTLFAGVMAIRDARISSERQLRAYILVRPGADVLQDDLANVRYELQPIIKNHGQTPAYDVRHVGMTRLVLQPMPDNYSFSIPSSWGNRGGSAIMGPDQELTVFNPADAMYPEHDVRQAESTGPMRIITFGEITYRDAFGKERFTRYCWVIHFKGGAALWLAHHSYNEAN